MALINRHIEDTTSSNIKVVDSSSQDNRISSLKKSLDDREIELAIVIYKKYLFVFQDNDLRIGSASHQQLLKQLWISALETRVDLDPLKL